MAWSCCFEIYSVSHNIPVFVRYKILFSVLIQRMSVTIKDQKETFLCDSVAGKKILKPQYNELQCLLCNSPVCVNIQ